MEYDKEVIDRLKRIEGQVRGVISMLEDSRDCRDVVTQLSASRSALDRVIGLIVSQNLEQCVRRNLEEGKSTEELVQEAVALLVKSR